MAYLGNSPGVSSQRVATTFTATAGQTAFNPVGGYTLGYADVFLNGVKLIDGTDFTAADGVTITLVAGAALNDNLETLCYTPHGLSDGYTKPEADARYQATSNGSIDVTGTVTAAAGIFTTADINAGTIDGTVIGGTTAAAGSFTTLGTTGAATFSGNVNSTAAGENLFSNVGNVSLAVQSNATDKISIGVEQGVGGTFVASGGALKFRVGGYTAAFDKAQIDPSGNLYVGGTDPAYDGTKLITGSYSATSAGLSILSNSSSGFGYLLFGDGAGTAGYSGQINYAHSTNRMGFNTNNVERMAIDASGNLGVGTSSPADYGATANTLEVKGASGSGIGALQLQGADSVVKALLYAGGSTEFVINTQSNHNMGFNTNNTRAMTIDASGNLGIGTATITNPYSQSNFTDVNINGVWGGAISFKLGGVTKGWVGQRSSGNEDMVIGATTGQELLFYENNAEAMRISSGNLLVGKTTTTFGTAGIALRGTVADFTRDGGTPINVNRLTSDGSLIDFHKAGTVVGSIGAASNVLTIFATSSSNCGIGFYSNRTVRPLNNSGAQSDNAIDLGDSGTRWDDIYATNGTIQTSDRNEKQDIEALSDAEQRVAVATKGLLRKFRWKSSVAEKGDEARTHFGIIAQDLQAAFEAEGLDAGRYAMFISSTWWETQTEVEAVEAVEFVQAVEAVYDENGELVSEAVEGVEAVEAKDAYTRTDTFQTLADAPEGATERTRLGVRYPELLAFIIAAI